MEAVKVKALAGTDTQAPWTFICDGLNTHKSEALVRFVYTPKHSSWMNQIEIWFGKPEATETEKLLETHK